MNKKRIFIFICMFVFLSVHLFCYADAISKEGEGDNTETEHAEKDRQRPRVHVPINQSAVTKPVEDTQPPPDLTKIGLQTPKLPEPFFGNTESYGELNYMEFGVKTKNGIAYSLHASEEVTENHTERKIGGGIRLPMKKAKRYFKKTKDVLTFVPKQIGRGAVSLFKFAVRLF